MTLDETQQPTFSLVLPGQIRNAVATMAVYGAPRRAHGRARQLVDAKKVKVHCSMLRDLIVAGPGDNPDILSKALDIVRSLRAAAEWDYPREILEDVKVRLGAWFSDRQWRGDDSELRRSLLQHVDQLPLAWNQPVNDKTDSALRTPN